jgi:thiol-disulfide isomerase/thioredoxin
MVSVRSTMSALGTPAPPFTLPDALGTDVLLAEHADGRPVLVAFVCNHCPYVRHIGPALGATADGWMQAGLAVIAINSNDVENYPDDRPDRMVATAQEWGWSFPYLVDESQQVAQAYRAACTPDFFLFDREHRLAYRGQFDDSRPRNEVAVTGADLDAAVRAVLEGRQPVDEQRPSMGCNIKWKPGNEPDYFA